MRHTYPGGEKETPDFETGDLTRAEYISAVVHFYRGELHRATLWRIRLDTSTNWAIISVMGLVTFSLGASTHPHVAILAGMALVTTFLWIEARRFRFFDVWRSRTRMLEENFMGPILRRDMFSPVAEWGTMVADDLLRPQFKMTFVQAFRARLMRNFIPLYVLLLVSWILKLTMVTDPEKPSSVLRRLEEGGVPPWMSVGFVALLYGTLTAICLFAPRSQSAEAAYWGGSAAPSGELERIDE